jgi:hypothetical protein
MDSNLLQFQYDKIYSYFRTTTEPFDLLDWDGHILEVWHKNIVVEKYKYKELKKLIYCF